MWRPCARTTSGRSWWARRSCAPPTRAHACRNCSVRQGPEEDDMKARIKWVEDVTFLGESGSGHAVVMDGPPENGGRNLGVRPMEMLLLGMGGCASFDVVPKIGRASCRERVCQGS